MDRNTLALPWSARLAGWLLLAVALPAQDLNSAPRALRAQLDADHELLSDASERALLTGRVLDTEGRPVAGALVVASAGGLTQSALDGRFLLELEIPPGAESMELTAVAGGSDGSARRLAHARVVLPGERGDVDAGDLELALTTCQPNWLPTFGAASGLLSVRALATYNDGSGPVLVVGGAFLHGLGDAQGVVTWNGARWSNLGGGMSGLLGTSDSDAYTSVDALAVWNDGTGLALYAGGNFTHAGGSPAVGIARWNGVSWSALGGGLNGPVRALATYDDGSGTGLFAGGQFGLAGGAPAARIAKWNGSSWSALGSGAGAAVRALCVHDDGSGPRLVVGGDFGTIGGLPAEGLARWDGTNWSAFGSGLSVGANVLALASFDDGGGSALYVGGRFTTAGGLAAPGLARWRAGAWTPFLSGPYLPVRAFTVFDDGSGAALYFAQCSQSSAYSAVGRWNGQAFASAGSFPEWTRALGSFDPGGGARLVAGGDYVEFGPGSALIALGIAQRTGTTWEPLDDGLDSWVMSLASHDQGSGPELYASGVFLAPGGTYGNTGPAKWNGTSWTSLTNGSYTAPDFLWWTASLVSHDDGAGPALFAAGGFTLIGGTNANRIARWNGTAWTALGSGLNDAVADVALFDDGAGTVLFAGGGFTTAGGLPASRVARWDGASWSALGSGLNNGVEVLAAHDDGSGAALYAGGSFTTAGGAPASRIARWDGASWSALGGGLNQRVLALASFDDGSGPALYAGGLFTQAGGVAASHIARWDGTSWSTLGSGMNAAVHTLTVFDDGNGPALYAGGQFTTAGGVSARRIARWNGSTWAALGSGTSGPVYALARHDDGSGPALFVGGGFLASQAGDSYLAKWGGCGEPPAIGVPMCFGTAAVCPCGNGGAPLSGCDNAQGTGGVRLTATGRPSHNSVVLHGSGFPPAATPGVIVFRGTTPEPTPVVFGDGLRCIGLSGLVRMGATTAMGGVSTHPLNHTAGPGGFLYQLWYRSLPMTFCDPAAGFNTSNGLILIWP
ncbi:MAG: hypothetical protein JNK02_15325 [Planctomycetes bacterium]|nr:hypothetical protein [Planctomycetota bacterium]